VNTFNFLFKRTNKTLQLIDCTRRAAGITAIALLLIACEDSPERNEAESLKKPIEAMIKITTTDSVLQGQKIDDPIVAKFNDDELRLADLNKTISLALFDLEWRKYELQRQQLNHIIAERVSGSTASSVEILLPPPEPPRIPLPSDDRPINGLRNAPVTLAIFCSFQSSHCARLQPILVDLQDRYSSTINFTHYDYPQTFHRYGLLAANAARCVASVAPPWAFHSALYADITKLSRDKFITIAAQLGLEQSQFEECLSGRPFDKDIAKDIDLARGLGLSNVPVVFINGLYVKGVQSLDRYSHYIDLELSRIGLSANAALPATKLPLRLLATSLSNQEANSTALIEQTNEHDIRMRKVGDELITGVFLQAIQADKVIIRNQETLEFIPLQSEQADKSVVNNTENAEDIISTSNPLVSEKPERSLPKKGELVLSTNWLQSELLNQAELEKHFRPSEHLVNGQYYLVRLEEIDRLPFYQTLGLEENDVVMKVNDEWVHSGQNSLWDELATKKEVSIVVMRKGYPHRYDYRIE